jgi:hypothetical protein
LQLPGASAEPARLWRVSPYCGEHYHIGRTATRRVLSQLPDELTENGIAVVGYSMVAPCC